MSNIKNENVYTGTKVLIYTFFVAPFIPGSKDEIKKNGTEEGSFL